MQFIGGITYSGGYSVVPPPGDTQFRYNSLLVSPSTVQSKNTTTTDSSSNALTVTKNGSPSTQWPSPYQSTGYWSTYFLGSTTTYYTIPASNIINFGTGNFTIEFWFNINTRASTNQGFGRSNFIAASEANVPSAFAFSLNGSTIGSTGISINICNTVVINNTNAISQGVWHHLAVSRSGTTVYLFLDGVSLGTGTSSGNIGNVPITIGAFKATDSFYDDYFAGFMSNFRVVKGTAVYTAAFTVPTAPLTAITNTSLLVLQDNRLKDNSVNNVTLTITGTPVISTFYPLTTINGSTGYFSSYFNGNADYLQIANNAAFDLGTGDCTMEAWVYTNSLSVTQTVFCAFPAVGTISGYAFLITTSGYLAIDSWVSGTEQSVNANSNAITIGSWFHVAFTRSSGTNRLFVNGNLCTTSSNTLVQALNTGGNAEKIGYQGYSGYLYPFNGYISNLRVIKGVALYTAAFTPSTVPLVAVANTSLLVCQNSTFIDNSTNAFAITRNGTPSTNVANPFSSTALTYFTTNYFGALGGALSLTTSDWLSGPGGAPFGFSTGDFTIEMWVYLTTTTGFPTFYDGRTAGGQIVPLLYNNNGTLTLYVGASAVITATMPTANVWHHIALSRNSSSTRLFVDGAQVGSTYSDTNDYITPSSGPTIGKNYTGASDAYGISGYVANYRVIKGTGVYTGAFTPPSMAPLTTAGSTSALSYTSTTNVNTAFAASSTSLLLNFAESNLSNPVYNSGQNNTFLDSGPNSLAITRNGTPTQGSFNPYMPNGYWGGYFNGSTDYLTAPYNAAFNFSTNDFTIESWIYPTSYASDIVYIGLATGTNTGRSWYLVLNITTGLIKFSYYTDGTTQIALTSSTAPTLNNWSHVAVTRSSGTTRIFLNGVQVGTASTQSGAMYTNASAVFTIGREAAFNGNYFPGYISNLRIVNGTAVYTSAFTVPTAPLTAITNTSLLTLQSNWFKDNSTNISTITANGTPQVQSFQPFNPPLAYSTATYGGSGYFGGTSNSLSITSTTPIVLNIGAAPTFTIEFWAYITSASSENVVDKGSQAGSTVPNYRVTIASGVLYLLWGAGDGSTYTAYNTTGYTIPYYTWAHCAIVANNAALTMYINGVSRYSGGTLASYSDNGKPLFISSRYNTDQWFYGYISNLRIVKGTAVYTGAFTPPYLPLATSGPVSAASYTSTTNINTIFPASQCSLLTNFTNGGIYDAVTQNNLTTVGDAKVSTTVVKFGLASLYFDGTGDYIDMVNSQAFIMGSGDFTVEAWVYPTTTNASHWMYLQGNASGFAAIRIGCQSNQAFLLMSINGSTWTVQSNLIGSVPINTWTYIALTRSSTTVNLYINGSSVYSSSALSTSALMTGTYNIIGRIDPTNLQYFAGYLQDVRLTKGVARYTSTFIVPTEALPLFGGSVTAPGAPTIGTATVLSGSSASVTFTAPWNTGGSPITSYIATSSPGGFTGTSATSPITVSGLTGSSYTFTVAGINSIGTGSSSAASNTISLSDPYYMYVPLLLETGSQSTRSTTVTDGAATPNTVTRNGTPSTGWTSPYQTVGYWSGYFNGSSDYLSIASSANLYFGTKDYTVEAWLYITGNSTNMSYFAAGATGGPLFNIGALTSVSINPYGTAPVNGSQGCVQSYSFSQNTWYHIAFTRASNTTRIFVNGVQVGSNVNDPTNYTQTSMHIGSAGGLQYYPGYISNLRVLLNTALYTSNFTPPTTPLTAVSGTSLLTLQDNRFKDNSTNTFTLTATGTPQTTPYFYPNGFTAPAASTGAGLLNGSTDYLTAPTNAVFNLGTGDFTVEFWIYPNVIPGASTYPPMLIIGTANFYINFRASGTIGLTDAGIVYATTASPLVTNTWYHIAVVRTSGSSKIYTNGVGGTAVACSVNFAQGSVTIGYDLSSFYLNAYISNLRIVKGTAVYTGNFTPPSGFVTQTGGTYPSTTNVNTSIPAANTSLLLNLADSNFTTVTNTAQNNNFVDNSNNAFTITRNGTPTQGSLTPYQPTGYWSAYFSDGTNYATIPNSSNLDLSTGDFTVECWFNTPSLRSPNPLIYRFNGNSNSFTDLQFAIGLDNANIGATVYYGNAGNTVASVTGAVSVGVWYHCALVRTGNNFYFYFNGTRYGSLSSASTLSNGAWATYFGFWRGGNISYPAIVSLSNVRIVKGTALYTAATITVPTSPLTAIANTQFLGFQDNRFKDNSTNNFTITPTGAGVPSIQASQPFSPAASYSAATYGGSGLFNGSTDYLTGTAPNLSGTWTVEMWCYWTTSGTQTTIVSFNNGSNSGINLWKNTSNQLVADDGVNGQTAFSTVTPTINAWNHIAFVRNGTTTSAYVNGVLAGSNSFTPLTTSAISIGRYNGGAFYYFPGYISNLRVVNGTAVYTGAFTPSTTPVTNIANTSLLCDFTNGAIVDYATVNNGFLLADARAKVISPTAKFGSTAMAFDGSGDYLTIPSNPNLSLTTANATVEFWMYPTAQDSYRRIVTSSIGAFTNNTFIIRYNNGTFIAGAAGSPVTASALPTLNAWTHIAWVSVNGTSQTLYFNGVNVGTATLTYSPTETIQYIGGYYTVGTTEFFAGYLQDLRITKGNARYTSNFTAPTSTLTSDGNTVLLLNAADNNYIGNSQNNTFVDSSSNSFTITRSGTPTQGSLNPYTPTGYWSGYFNGSSDYLSFTNTPVFDFGSGDLTIECWIYPLSSSYNDIVSLGNGTGTGYGWWFRRNANGTIVFFFSSNGQNSGITSATTWQSTTTAPLNTWTHIAAVRSGSTGYIFINGTIGVTNSSVSGSVYAVGSQVLNIGREGGYPAGYTNAYISNLRIVKGTPVYTGAFTPSNTPLTAIANTSLLTLQDNRFKDNSTSPLTITPVSTVSIKSFQPFTTPTYSAATYGGSGYFNGSTDYLTVPSNAAFSFGTGDFTIEAWIYTTNPANTYGKMVIDSRPDNTNGAYWLFGITNTGGCTFVTMTTGGTTLTSPSAIPFNQWVHLAATRTSGGTLNLWVNGTSVATASNNTDNISSDVLKIGTNAFRSTAPETYFLGNMSNIRIIKGTAVYTGAFTPPSLAPLTTAGSTSAASYPSTTNVNTSFAASNTSLLTNFTNAGIYDASAQNVLTTLGDAGTATLVSRFGSTSMYFDGTGDYVSLPYNAADNYGVGDLTIECWFYPNGTQGSGANFFSYTNGSAYGLIVHSNLTAYPNVVTMWCDTYGAGPFITGNTILNKNTWYHFALTRSSGVWRMFINGILQGSTYTNAATPDRGYDLRIGGDNNSAGRAFTGHIQDFRITRGVARYTSNFTIPTAQLPRS